MFTYKHSMWDPLCVGIVISTIAINAVLEFQCYRILAWQLCHHFLFSLTLPAATWQQLGCGVLLFLESFHGAHDGLAPHIPTAQQGEQLCAECGARPVSLCVCSGDLYLYTCMAVHNQQSVAVCVGVLCVG